MTFFCFFGEIGLVFPKPFPYNISMKSEEKTKNDSRIHRENDDNIYRDNEKKRTKKKGVHTMKEIIFQIIAPLWAVTVALLPAVLLFIL